MPLGDLLLPRKARLQEPSNLGEDITVQRTRKIATHTHQQAIFVRVVWVGFCGTTTAAAKPKSVTMSLYYAPQRLRGTDSQKTTGESEGAFRVAMAMYVCHFLVAQPKQSKKCPRRVVNSSVGHVSCILLHMNMSKLIVQRSVLEIKLDCQCTMRSPFREALNERTEGGGGGALGTRLSKEKGAVLQLLSSSTHQQSNTLKDYKTVHTKMHHNSLSLSLFSLQSSQPFSQSRFESTRPLTTVTRFTVSNNGSRVRVTSTSPQHNTTSYRIAYRIVGESASTKRGMYDTFELYSCMYDSHLHHIHD